MPPPNKNFDQATGRRSTVRLHASRQTPQLLSDILSHLFTSRGWGRRQEQLQLDRIWADVAGEDVAAQTRIVGIRRGTIEIVVASAVLMQELAHYRKRQILEGLRHRLPGTQLTNIRFRTGVLDNG